jgi:hypothetical protein
MALKLLKGGLMSKDKDWLWLPTKLAILHLFVGNGTKVKLPSEIKPPLVT